MRRQYPRAAAPVSTPRRGLVVRERPLALQAIAEMAEQHATDRSHRIADGELPERLDEIEEWIGRRKEARADDRRQKCEDDEVVPLRRINWPPRLDQPLRRLTRAVGAVTFPLTRAGGP
jgi:hypothetical protein